jgi:hypothetical protein
MNKQWIYRNGDKPFSVTEIELPDGSLCFASAQSQGFLRFHYSNGKVLGLGGNRDLDLFPYEPYGDYKNGDEVYVHDGNNPIPTAAYFFGLDGEGRPLTYPSGTSPFTYVAEDGVMSAWDFCEKAAPKEDK